MKSLSEHNNAAALQECLDSFLQVVDVAPSVFDDHAEDISGLMLGICGNHERSSDRVRQIAFEVLVSLIENSGKPCSQSPSFVKQVVQLCLDFVLSKEEEEADAGLEEEAAAAEQSWAEVANYEVGLENLDRFASALGAKAVLPQAFEVMRDFMGRQSWQHRYAAMMALSQFIESVGEDGEHIDEIVQLLASLLKDSAPRVRCGALHAIGQAATDRAPYMQENFHNMLLPELMRMLEDPVPRVAASAAAAFVNFAEELDAEVLLPYLPSLVDTLCGQLKSEDRGVREQVVPAISTLASASGATFVSYYQQVMPILKNMVMSATKEDESKLRGRAFECMSLLGIAVGREVFQEDANDALTVMLEVPSNGLEACEVQKTCVSEAFQRICRLLREDFQPYLRRLLPGVLALLQKEPYTVADSDSEDMAITSLPDGSLVGLKTSQVEDVHRAVQMLSCFMESLSGHYFDYIKETAPPLLRVLRFKLSEDVKRDAFNAFQELISAARGGLQQRGDLQDTGGLIPQLLHGFLRSALDEMAEEDNIELLQVEAAGVAACVRAAGADALSLDMVQQLSTRLFELMEEASRRLQDTWAESADPGLEDEGSEVQHHRLADDVLRRQYLEVLSALMLTHRAAFLQVGLAQFLPVIRELLASGRDARDRSFALALAGEVIEKLKDDGSSCWPAFMEPLLTSTRDEDAAVRQAAVGCISQAAQLKDFGPFAERAALALLEVVAEPAVRDGGMKAVSEPAVCCIVVLLRCQCGRLGAVLERSLLLLLEMLPILDDVEQAAHTHEAFFKMVREGKPFFQKHWTKVCKIFLDVYERDISSKALDADIRRLFYDAGEDALRQLQPPLAEKYQKRALKVLRDARKPKT
eukprot:TRINITY_DN19309_c0_g2_i1.p1 TRINITY_DN19309_c0_g2~~TRINITY_DN19309_c0_g2_i1.p1  ORF type:complete len:870 (-),score=258.50 TRINITY_DN19309_c0_g2_i1:486-3095(-)